MAEGGYLNWSTTTAENALQETPVIAGEQWNSLGVAPSGSFGGGGIRIQKLDGRFIHHFTAGHPNQPVHTGPPSLNFETRLIDDIDDWRRVGRLAAQAMLEDVEVLLRLEISDTWLIEASRSLWTPSFKMGFGTAIAASFSPALPTPVVQVVDSSNAVQSTLTVVSGAPSAGEVQIDETTDSQLLTTNDGDLDSDAGDRLICYYVPLLPVTLLAAPWSRPELNILAGTLEMQVAAPDMDWSTDTP